MKSFKLPSILSIAFTSTLITTLNGCTPLQASFPPGVDQTNYTLHEVKGLQSFAFTSGNYSIGSHPVEWTRSASSSQSSKTSIFMVSSENHVSQQSYTVSIPNSGSAIKGAQCKSQAEIEASAIKASKTDTFSSEGIISSTLSCELSATGKSGYKLELAQDSNHIMKKRGKLKGDDISVAIESTGNSSSGMALMGGITGYYLTEAGRLLAVVDVLNGGAVFLANNLDNQKQDLLLNASAALLSYKDLATKHR